MNSCINDQTGDPRDSKMFIFLFYVENFRSLAAPPYKKLTGSYVHILL